MFPGADSLVSRGSMAKVSFIHVQKGGRGEVAIDSGLTPRSRSDCNQGSRMSDCARPHSPAMHKAYIWSANALSPVDAACGADTRSVMVSARLKASAAVAHRR